MWLFELSLESKISKTLRTICLMNRNPILIFVTILRKNHPPDPSSIVHPRKRPFLWMETKMGAPEKAEIAFRRKIAYFLYEKDLFYSAGGGGGLRRPRARKGVVWCTRGGLRPSRARKGVVWCTRGGLRRPRARKEVVWCTYRLWTSYLSMPISRRSRMKSEVTATWNFLE